MTLEKSSDAFWLKKDSRYPGETLILRIVPFGEIKRPCRGALQ
jgi:hypothetical protein